MRTRFFNLSLASRVTVVAMLLIVLFAAAIGYFVVESDRRAYFADRSASMHNSLQRNAAQLARSIESLRRDTLVLARTPPAQGIIRALRNKGFDAQEGITLAFWEKRLPEIFSIFVESNRRYFQVRYIGIADGGRELIRIDLKDGRPVPTTPRKLARKGDRDYFQATTKLKAGEVYLSEINLNQEEGKVQVPHVRTMRAATPIFAPDGELFGMVVINLDIGPWIDDATTNLPPGVHAYFMNAAGDYLAHPDPSRAFGFDLGRRHTWQEDMPGLQLPSRPPAVQRPLQAVSAPGGLLHVATEHVQFDPGAQERFVLLAYALPDSVVEAWGAGARRTTVIITAALALLLGGGMFLFLRRAFAPLTRLTALAGSIGEGRYEVPLPAEGAGEVGVLVRALGNMRDQISAREREIREANTAIRQSEARLQTVVENLSEGVAVSDLDGTLLHFNRAAMEMHGFTDKHEYLRRLPEFADTFELAGLDGTVWPVDQWPLARILRGESLHDLEVNIRRVRTDWQRVFSYGGTFVRDADGQPLLAVVTIRDITERKQAENRIQAQMERAEALLESAPDPIVIVDRVGRIAVLNAQAERVFGYAREELLGRSVEALIPERLHAAHVAQRAPYQERNPQARAMGTGRELLARRKDGSEFAVDVSLSPLATPEGTLIISTVRDVTERKQAERRIRQQLEHMNLLDQITRSIGERLDLPSIFQVVVRTVEDSLPVDFCCIGLFDPTANALRVERVGVKSEALAMELALAERASIGVDENGLGRCIGGQLVYEPDISQVPFPFAERLARGGLRSLVLAPLRSESRVFGVLVAARREEHGFASVECEFLRQLSEHVALAAGQAQLHGALQQAYDDLRQTQQVVMQEERLRALGQMASGIAHDINNALSPVSLYTESLLETEPNLSDRARGYLETIQRAVEDVAQTVGRMREFYRKREVQLELASVDVNRLVQQVLDLTRARWSDMPQQHGISIRPLTELAPDLPKVMGVESEIREALTNLVFNAVDAMPEGGTLTLRTRLARAAGGDERDAIVIEVADDGVGMEEDTRRRCLEPFFTTKGERGTGLVLAMVFGTVQRHSAELEIESASGRGTTVRLIFAVPATVATAPGQPARTAEAPSRLRLLLIDDDPILLKSLRDALETDGHVLVTANGGAEGISVFRTSLDRGETFAAVFTDLGMPYVDGRKVAAAVKEASPATPVILLTGWGQRLVAEGDIPPHVDRVLAKPPKLRDVREALAQLCRSAAA